jgi:membrane protease YdiL (CAAX protease family)
MDVMKTVLLSLVLVAYSFVVSMFTPSWFRFVANLALASSVIYLGRRLGLTHDDIGISRDAWTRGFALGLVLASLVLMLIIGAAIEREDVAQRLSKAEDVPSRLSVLLYEVLVRIPFETAAVEETLFRGVIFALWKKTRGTIGAVLGSSIAYSLWHIGPSLSDRESPFALEGLVSDLGGPLLLTLVLGFIYAGLRLATKGVVGPALVHWAQNGGLKVAGYITLH